MMIMVFGKTVMNNWKTKDKSYITQRKQQTREKANEKNTIREDENPCSYSSRAVHGRLCQ